MVEAPQRCLVVGSFSREFHPFHRETGKLIDRLFASIFLSSPSFCSLRERIISLEDRHQFVPPRTSGSTSFLSSFERYRIAELNTKGKKGRRGKVFIRPFRGKQTNLPSLPDGQNDEKKANELGQRVRDASSNESRQLYRNNLGQGSRLEIGSCHFLNDSLKPPCCLNDRRGYWKQ